MFTQRVDLPPVWALPPEPLCLMRVCQQSLPVRPSFSEVFEKSTDIVGKGNRPDPGAAAGGSSHQNLPLRQREGSSLATEGVLSRGREFSGGLTLQWSILRERKLLTGECSEPIDLDMIIAVVLAAGASHRMGRPKLELDLGGRRILDRTIDTILATEVSEVLVVVSPNGTRPSVDSSRVRIVENPRAEEGIGSSIRAAMRALPEKARAVMIVLGDKPLVRPVTVRHLLKQFETSGAPVVYPTYRGRQGHPVLLARALFAELRRLHGDRGAKPLLNEFSHQAVSVEVDDPGVVLDIDTPDEYSRLVGNRSS